MIKATNLTKIFPGKKVVDDISFQIGKGEIVGLLGPNGAGKTTTIRMIAGTLPPSRGQVLIEGENLFESSQTIKNSIGYLPENNPLYDFLTVEEHLKFWLSLKNFQDENKEQTIDHLVGELGLAEVYYRLIGQLSKGFRQRVGLSQALLGQPKILLLDEPTEGLDPNQRREIETLIKGLGQERTVIICSHVLSEVTKICQRVIIINHGKIVADDQVARLIHGQKNRQILTLIAQGKDIKSTLLSLEGVTSVKIENDSGQEKFVVTANGELDLRPAIFNLAKDNGWQLLELKLSEVSLEDVFSDLTKE